MKKTTAIEKTRHVKLLKVITKTGKKKYYLSFPYGVYFRNWQILEALTTLGLADRLENGRLLFRTRADALSAMSMILLTIQ